MTNLFAKAITPRIEALAFIERWGGAVMPIEARSSYTTPEGKEVTVMQSYPISCTHDEGICDDDGYAQGYYTKMLPNDSYLSVAYLESLGPVEYSSPEQYSMAVQGRARFVAWLNMQRLGALYCGAAEAFALHASKALDRRAVMEVAEDVYQYPASVRAKVTALHFSPQEVFGRYTYAVEPRLFIHPYSFFGIDLAFSAVIPLACLCLPEIEAVECIETW